MLFALRSINVSAKEALRSGVTQLQRAHIESASLDARLLLEHVLGTTREQLLFALDQPLSVEQELLYHKLIGKRCKRQPVAQLTGKREFWGMELKVTGSTLDPRPDSETLIEALLARLDRNAELRILDLGTGTGCLLLALLKEFPSATGVGVDACGQALTVAKENVKTNGMEMRAEFIQSNWCEKVSGMFDVVISNPPYIESAAIGGLAPEVAEYEPKGALDGGSDGLDCYRAILSQLPAVLNKGGVAAFEIGFGQQQALEALAAQAGLEVLEVRPDLNGIARCVLMTKP